MENNNRFRIYFIAKRFSYTCIYFSLGILLVGGITSIIVLNTPLIRLAQIAYGPIFPDPRDIFFSQVLPSMVISGISGLIIFIPLNYVLSYKLKSLNPINKKIELKLNQKLEYFKLKAGDKNIDIYFKASLKEIPFS